MQHIQTSKFAQIKWAVSLMDEIFWPQIIFPQHPNVINISLPSSKSVFSQIIFSIWLQFKAMGDFTLCSLSIWLWTLKCRQFLLTEKCFVFQLLNKADRTKKGQVWTHIFCICLTRDKELLTELAIKMAIITCLECREWLQQGCGWERRLVWLDPGQFRYFWGDIV